MKTIKFLFIVLAFLFCTETVKATPIYTEDPYANFGVANGGFPDNPKNPGYYIWANNLENTDWSVRWTGRDFTKDTLSYSWYDWYGSIVLSPSENEKIDGHKLFLWEPNDGTVEIDGDILTYGIATNGHHWDGFDFTLTGMTYGSSLTFNLASNTFRDFPESIYIGQDMLALSSTDFITEGDMRSFQIGGAETAPVPEPTTLALLGTGLIGMVLYGRKKKMLKN